MTKETSEEQLDETRRLRAAVRYLANVVSEIAGDLDTLVDKESMSGLGYIHRNVQHTVNEMLNHN